MLNPKTIKACLSKTSLSFIPQLSSDPFFCCLLLQSLSLALLDYMCYPNLSSALATPHPLPLVLSCPGPLVSWKSFVLFASYNKCTHTLTQMEWVYFSSLNIYLTVRVLTKKVSSDILEYPNILQDSLWLMKKEVNKKYTDILPSFWKENNLPYSFIGKEIQYTLMKKPNNKIYFFDWIITSKPLIPSN